MSGSSESRPDGIPADPIDYRLPEEDLIEHGMSAFQIYGPDGSPVGQPVWGYDAADWDVSLKPGYSCQPLNQNSN